MEFLKYAKSENLPLHVTITDGKDRRFFKYTVDELKKSIKRYCAWYNTTEASKAYTDYGETISLANGITFDVILY